MKIDELYRLFLESEGVTTDTRKCGPGLIYFALKGERFDGNMFARQALELGCKYAVIDSQDCCDSTEERLIKVDNVLKTMQELARYHRRTLKTTVIGITGTNGKTTTKELISAVMSRSFNILSTEGNLNNSIGVPITVLKLKPQHQYAIVEMGASHPGDIKELVDICEPDYGLITNVGKAHLLGFGSFEGVISTKGELYDFIRDRKNGKIFLNADNEYLRRMATGLVSICYGKPSDRGNLSIIGDTIACDPYLRFRWKRYDESDFRQVNTHLIGSYNFDNALAAVAIGDYFGVSAEKISEAIESYKPSNNRSQLAETASNKIIVDAYNANPTSMMAALDNFNIMQANNKTLILGDMRELGESSEAEHLKVLESIIKFGFTDVYLVGVEFSKANDAKGYGFKHYNTVEDMAEMLKKNPLKERTILLKGSNGIHLTGLLDLL
jgi:UDP-N-acetylmuramoyl-tripeptide--D-alanyl-D-alanine ligase